MVEKYVDDVNLVVEVIGAGWEWTRVTDKKEEVFIWTQDRADIDLKEGLPPEERWMDGYIYSYSHAWYWRYIIGRGIHKITRGKRGVNFVHSM